MSHGIHNHGQHQFHGNHIHGNHGAAAAKGASGEKKALAGAAASTPAAQAQQAGQTQAAQQPNMDSAMAALDQAIKSLAANFHADSFNGQQAPAGVQAAPSTLTNNVGSRSSDLFLQNAGAAPAQVPQAQLQSAPVADAGAPANILDIRGGGGLPGGVLAGGGSFLGQSGGGGLPGGVLPTSKL